MPDRTKVDLTQTGIEKMTGIVDPYAEAMRAALAAGTSPRPADRRRADDVAQLSKEMTADYGELA